LTSINIFVSGDEPRKVIFKDDLGCDEACKEQNSSKEDCDQQRVDSEPVTNNQGKGNSFSVPGEAESSNTCINIRVKWVVEYKIYLHFIAWDYPFKTSAFFRGGGVKNLPNLPTDSCKKLPTDGGRSQKS
jgi:hypothetical protein